ncbi:hypothetical protein [Xanthomonas cannabis]|uniref:hypothetical protein n=1 Tax=Xanthomonas cannabis TaxID=1885674 RepID=UPI00141A9BDB|nr:hypothetical protein [Xanthomonas cannabis]NIK03298.1 hypothetical protein [Xanthomonas cannabis]NIK63205.1 hypothetical protein [Xanthomonas cannabis]
MRLVRYLILLIVVLSTTAWAAPTQSELPISWPQAALLTQPAAAERDLRIVMGHCEPEVQGAAVHACDRLTGRLDWDDDGQGLVSRPRKVSGTHEHDRAGTSTGMANAWSIRGQTKVAFRNQTERDDRLRRSAGI